MSQRNIFDHFQRLLQETNGELRILEHQVPVEMQMEYFKYANRLRKVALPMEENEFEYYATDLYSSDSSLERKKQLLSTLAISKQPKAYRILEKYVQTTDTELKDWAAMALMESRIALESELSGERQIFISSGLGGKGNKLRFYILLLSASGNPFLDYQQQVIEREFNYMLLQQDSEIEHLTVKDNYAELIVLTPIQLDIVHMIENIVTECNQYGDFISNTIALTNVKRLSEDEIAQIIQRHEGNQAGS